MKLGKDFVDEYARFNDNCVTVEIPFISLQHGEEFTKMLAKSIITADLKGNITTLATSAVIVGFAYEFGENETRQLIERFLEILSGSIMIQYYNQRDKSEIVEIQLAIAA